MINVDRISLHEISGTCGEQNARVTLEMCGDRPDKSKAGRISIINEYCPDERASFIMTPKQLRMLAEIIENGEGKITLSM